MGCFITMGGRVSSLSVAVELSLSSLVRSMVTSGSAMSFCVVWGRCRVEWDCLGVVVVREVVDQNVSVIAMSDISREPKAHLQSPGRESREKSIERTRKRRERDQ